jgi:hypothetical protein
MIAIIGMITVILVCCCLYFQNNSEHFYSSFASPSFAYPYSQAQLEAECARWNGVVIEHKQTGDKKCWLPQTIQNDEILNFQLAGRMCDLDKMIESQGCGIKGIETPPMLQSAQRGNGHYNI